MSGFVIERPGLLTTVQDGGRWGWQHLGVSVSGWMDDWSPRLANRLVWNHDDAAVLEFTLTGPTLCAECDLVVAVTGAVVDVTAAGRRLRSPCRTVLRAGEALSVERRHHGARGYVACAGGLATTAVLGSRSSDLRAGLGARVERGHRCDVGESSVQAADVETRELPAPGWLFESRLHVIAGPEDAHWTAIALAQLCAGSYSVSTASDRTGYRLEGMTLPAPSGSLVSGPVGAGVLQVPPSGHPILLMSESQTTGGYARLGAIAAADRAVAGQLAPADRVTFCEVTREQSAKLTAERHACLGEMVESAR